MVLYYRLLGDIAALQCRSLPFDIENRRIGDR